MRLAREQGLLSNPSLNWFQRWALTYVMSLDLRHDEDLREAYLRKQTLIQSPERYLEVFAPEVAPLVAHMDTDEQELPVSPEEFADFDSFLTELDKVRGTSGASVVPFGDDDGEWK